MPEMYISECQIMIATFSMEGIGKKNYLQWNWPKNIVIGG